MLDGKRFHTVVVVVVVNIVATLWHVVFLLFKSLFVVYFRSVQRLLYL